MKAKRARTKGIISSEEVLVRIQSKNLIPPMAEASIISSSEYSGPLCSHQNPLQKIFERELSLMKLKYCFLPLDQIKCKVVEKLGKKEFLQFCGRKKNNVSFSASLWGMQSTSKSRPAPPSVKPTNRPRRSCIRPLLFHSPKKCEIKSKLEKRKQAENVKRKEKKRVTFNEESLIEEFDEYTPRKEIQDFDFENIPPFRNWQTNTNKITTLETNEDSYDQRTDTTNASNHAMQGEDRSDSCQSVITLQNNHVAITTAPNSLGKERQDEIEGSVETIDHDEQTDRGDSNQSDNAQCSHSSQSPAPAWMEVNMKVSISKKISPKYMCGISKGYQTTVAHEMENAIFPINCVDILHQSKESKPASGDVSPFSSEDLTEQTQNADKEVMDDDVNETNDCVPEKSIDVLQLALDDEPSGHSQSRNTSEGETISVPLRRSNRIRKSGKKGKITNRKLKKSPCDDVGEGTQIPKTIPQKKMKKIVIEKNKEMKDNQVANETLAKEQKLLGKEQESVSPPSSGTQDTEVEVVRRVAVQKPIVTHNGQKSSLRRPLWKTNKQLVLNQDFDSSSDCNSTDGREYDDGSWGEYTDSSAIQLSGEVGKNAVCKQTLQANEGYLGNMDVITEGRESIFTESEDEMFGKAGECQLESSPEILCHEESIENDAGRSYKSWDLNIELSPITELQDAPRRSMGSSVGSFLEGMFDEPLSVSSGSQVVRIEPINLNSSAFEL